MNTKSPSKNMLTLISAGVIGLAFAGAPAALAQTQAAKPAAAQAQPEKKPEVKKETTKKVEAAKVGDKAPAFSLFDTESKEHTLASLAGKIVVLEWFNPDCPVVKAYHANNKTVNELYSNYSKKDVVFLAVNSGAAGEQGTGKDRNAKARKDYALEFPILLDESGTTGRSYGAKATPTAVIIGKDGTIAYWGAIDDDSSTGKGKTNYVAKALDELLAGKPVSTKETKATGCNVKYKG